ncbi:hypothetical protein LguiA_007161 [Lonicera macranthoides]
MYLTTLDRHKLTCPKIDENRIAWGQAKLTGKGPEKSREVDQSIAQCDYPSTRLVGSARGDESTEELEILKGIDTMMVLHDLPYNEEKAGRVQAARKDDLVIGAGTNAGVLLIDRFGDGLLLEAPDQDFDFLGNTSFNLLQGCRMRNIKTIFTSRSSSPAPSKEKDKAPHYCSFIQTATLHLNSLNSMP